VNIQDVLNPNPPLRTAEQWKEILRWAVKELEETIGVAARMTEFRTEDDKAGYASHDNGVDVVFDTQTELGFQLCGCVCCRVNVGEGVWIDAEFLAFHDGIRVPEHASQSLIYTFSADSINRQKWSCSGWQKDEYGEWEGYKDSSRWSKRSGR
jgi:hypothetical protein